MARADFNDPQTGSRPYTTAENSPRLESASEISAVRGLIDPHGSAIFWIGLAAVLGLVLVSGELRVQAALASRVGKGKR